MRNSAIGYGLGFGACLAVATVLILASNFGQGAWAAGIFCLAALAVLAGFLLRVLMARKPRR